MSVTIKLYKFEHGKYTPKPKLHKKAFYKIFSPKTFKLAPMESTNLNLQFNITSSEGMILDLQLSPTLKQFGISIEESNWNTASKPDIQSDTIIINLLNKNCSHAFNIKKGQLLLYLVLPYTNKRIFTEYEYSKSIDEN